MFELDSGAQASTISCSVARDVNGKIVPTTRTVRAYNGSLVPLCGVTTLNVLLNSIKVQHTFLVVKSSSINLFGRDLFDKFGITIHVPEVEPCNSVNVLDEFHEFLSPNFQSAVKETVTLKITPGASPVFCKARPIPVRLRDRVKTELQRLVDSGKLTRVYSSDYASPIVVCFKKDGSLRICGDFSVSINKHLDSVQAPLPTIDEVLTKVGNAKIFSQIDLSQAFLQLPLSEESKQYTTINTSEGLFRYNFLPPPYSKRLRSLIRSFFISSLLRYT